MLTVPQALITTVVIAAVTFLTRLIPFLFFRGRTPPPVVLYAGRYIPSIVMTLLVVYALKDVQFTAVPYGLPEIGAAVLCGVLHLWKRNALISIGCATAVYMALVQTGAFHALFGTV